MFTGKPSATTMAAAALLLLVLLAASSPSAVESADCTSLYRTCRFAVTNGGVAKDRCCDGLFSSRVDCYCEVVRRIRADGLAVGSVSCLRDATCLRGTDGSSSSSA